MTEEKDPTPETVEDDNVEAPEPDGKEKETEEAPEA